MQQWLRRPNLAILGYRSFSLRSSLRPLSPAVARLVETHNLNVSAISASGPKNNILKGDVLSFLARPQATSDDRRRRGSASFSVERQQLVKLRTTLNIQQNDQLNRLIAVALCRAAAQQSSPAHWAFIKNAGNENGTRMIQLGASSSAPTSPQGKDQSPFLHITFAGMPQPTDCPVTIEVNVDATHDRYNLQLEHSSSSFDCSQFIKTFTENITDPYMMLL